MFGREGGREGGGAAKTALSFIDSFFYDCRPHFDKLVAFQEDRVEPGQEAVSRQDRVPLVANLARTPQKKEFQPKM